MSHCDRVACSLQAGEVARRAVASRAPREGAKPRFLRVQPTIKVTPTLKHIKTDLVREGFDLGLCGGDKLYFLDSTNKTYSPLDAVAYDGVISGHIRM